MFVKVGAAFPSEWKLISEKSNIAPPLSCQIKLNTQESCCFPKVEIDIREEQHSSASVLPDQAEYSRKLLLSQSGNWYQRANLLSHVQHTSANVLLSLKLEISEIFLGLLWISLGIGVQSQESEWTLISESKPPFPQHTSFTVLLSLTLEISEMILGISVVGDIIRCRIPWWGSSLGAPRLFWAPDVNILHRNIFWSVRLPDGPPFSDSWSVLTSRFFVDRKNGFHLHRKRKLKMLRKKSVWREKTSYQRERSFLRYSWPVLTSCHTESPACSLPSL